MLGRSQRRVGATFAGVEGGYPLGKEAQGGSRVPDEGRAGLSHHVDEAGGDDLPLHVDDTSSGRATEPTDRGDLAPLDAEVGMEGRRAGAVDDARVPEDDVVLLAGEQGR